MKSGLIGGGTAEKDLSRGGERSDTTTRPMIPVG
jgi:hypothetical protein